MRTFALFTCFFLAAFIQGSAQLTLKIASSPTYFTPLVDPIHVAGTFNNWNAADPAWEMIKQPDGSYAITITGTPGTVVEYKYVRGQWPRVETNASGGFLPNRSFTFQNGATISDAVANWEDLPGPHTAVGNTRILTMDFPIPQFNRSRRIWVYLPQDYFLSTLDYPVLYMHDGQNLFDEITTAFGTEWAIDEAMEMLTDSGYTQAIIVGIDNGGGDRIAEYTPWSHPQYGGGDGDTYMDWLVQDLKPYIDGYFRTKSGQAFTGLMGSSLGGLLSMYGGLQYPQVFGKLGVFSPSFWYNDSCFTHARLRAPMTAAPMRVYMLAGGQESTSMVPDMMAMEDTLLANGLTAAEVRSVVKQDGQHSEWFWAREFPEAFKWLFAESATAMDPSLPEARLFAYPALFQDHFELRSNAGMQGKARLRLRDLSGRQVFEGVGVIGQAVRADGLSNGSYLLEIEQGGVVWRQRLVRVGE